jgi:DNA-binding HxlR family transcriptional regulator
MAATVSSVLRFFVSCSNVVNADFVSPRSFVRIACATLPVQTHLFLDAEFLWKSGSSHSLHSASDIDTVSDVPGKPKSKRRSGCPVSISLERFGDRWSLLIIRDLMVRGFRTFKEFQESDEGIATNILADRLRKLKSAGIITAEVEQADGRRVNYRLTEKGIDLAPVLLDLLIWGARHEETGAPCALIAQMAKNREQVLAEARRRWQERDSTPLIPRFGNGDVSRNSRRRKA